MSLIKNAYNLSNGHSESEEVNNPNNWRITATTTEMQPGQSIELAVYVAGEDNKYAPLTDENDRHIKKTIDTNRTVSINLAGVNAAKGKVEIIVPDDTVGLIDIDSINS